MFSRLKTKIKDFLWHQKNPRVVFRDKYFKITDITFPPPGPSLGIIEIQVCRGARTEHLYYPEWYKGGFQDVFTEKGEDYREFDYIYLDAGKDEFLQYEDRVKEKAKGWAEVNSSELHSGIDTICNWLKPFVLERHRKSDEAARNLIEHEKWKKMWAY